MVGVFLLGSALATTATVSPHSTFPGHTQPLHTNSEKGDKNRIMSVIRLVKGEHEAKVKIGSY